MEAKELMLGNWVYVPHNGSASHYGRVNAIHESTNSISVKLEDGNCLCDVRSLRPISLTPEILEKNGFKKAVPDNYPEQRYVWGIDSGRNGTVITITIYEKPIHGVKMLTKIDTDCSHACGINSIHNCDIESVHELQHALRLCGIDKEIKL